jgi:hypothetical protein
MSKKGWAFTVMGAKRWAEEGIQEGTFYDAYGAYLGIEKKINDNHTITFNTFASPYRRSTASPSTQKFLTTEECITTHIGDGKMVKREVKELEKVSSLFSDTGLFKNQ